ncbi:MAG: molybdopterin-dependent oxidoreductase [Chloroflexota bacterium]
MKRPSIWMGILVGGLLTAPLIVVLYLANRWLGLPFLPFDLFDWLTRILPGPVVTFGIDFMIDAMLALRLNVADAAKTAEQISAILQFLAIGAVTGGIFFTLFNWRKLNPDAFTGLVVGALFGLPLITISLSINQSGVEPFFQAIWLGFLLLAWGMALVWSYRRLSVPTAVLTGGESGGEVREVATVDRRQFLIRLGAASATITVVGGGLAAFLTSREQQADEAVLDASMAHQSEGTPGRIFPNANDPVVPAPGTRPEYTPVKDHYKVFLRTEPTVIPEEGYVLPITGLVANPAMLTLDDLHNNYESFDQYVTLSCISGRIGTSLISTTQWTGVSLQDILDDVQPTSEARYLTITSGDGFHESIPLDLIASDRRLMLCHSWDGNKLPVDHGFPLRVWIPDRFGMKQPKWITGMELLAEYEPGYWVERNWDEVAEVKTTSVIDTVAVDAVYDQGGQQLVPIGGIAWAGARGISQVEVRFDGGDWTEAQLRSPLSETTWVIWRYDWAFTPGEHTVEVRCAEGDGTPQIETRADARPSGATGIHSVTTSL